MNRVDNNEEALQGARGELEVKVRGRAADLGRGNEQLQKEVVEPGRAEESLRESEARFRAMFENSGSGMALIDMQGRPIECNPTFQKTLGYTETRNLSGARPNSNACRRRLSTARRWRAWVNSPRASPTS
jgi:PAS domain-containing protein